MPDPLDPELSRRQAELVAALTGTGESPPGFSARQVEVARRALLSKRARTLAVVWPELVASLGDDLVPLFAEFAAERPTRGPRRDGHDLAVWLHERGRLTPAAAREVLEARLWWHFPDDGGRPVPRPGGVVSARGPGGRAWRWGERVIVLGPRG